MFAVGIVLFALAILLSGLINDVVKSEEIPVAWKGGRAADLYKGKGDAADTNASRVLLIQDHMGKVIVEMLKSRVVNGFEADNPGDQYGGVSG